MFPYYWTFFFFSGCGPRGREKKKQAWVDASLPPPFVSHEWWKKKYPLLPPTKKLILKSSRYVVFKFFASPRKKKSVFFSLSSSVMEREIDNLKNQNIIISLPSGERAGGGETTSNSLLFFFFLVGSIFFRFNENVIVELWIFHDQFSLKLQHLNIQQKKKRKRENDFFCLLVHLWGVQVCHCVCVWQRHFVPNGLQFVDKWETT